MDYKSKYLKYKNKYLELKKLIGGTSYGISMDISRECKNTGSLSNYFTDGYRITLSNSSDNLSIFSSLIEDIVRQHNDENDIQDEHIIFNITYQINRIQNGKVSFDDSISNTVEYIKLTEEEESKFRREIASQNHTFDLSNINEVNELINLICEIFAIDLRETIRNHFASRLFNNNRESL